MKTFTKHNLKNQIALTIRNTTCCDLKTFAFGHPEFFKDLRYFMKSSYAEYLKQDKMEGLNENQIRENIQYYWSLFQNDIRFLNLS